MDPNFAMSGSGMPNHLSGPEEDHAWGPQQPQPWGFQQAPLNPQVHLPQVPPQQQPLPGPFSPMDGQFGPMHGQAPPMPPQPVAGYNPAYEGLVTGNMPVNQPANLPVNLPANLSVNLPVNLPAKVPVYLPRPRRHARAPRQGNPRSCTACQLSKKRCDRQSPCEECRKIGKDCVYGRASKRPRTLTLEEREQRDAQAAPPPAGLPDPVPDADHAAQGPGALQDGQGGNDYAALLVDDDIAGLVASEPEDQPAPQEPRRDDNGVDALLGDPEFAAWVASPDFGAALAEADFNASVADAATAALFAPGNEDLPGPQEPANNNGGFDASGAAMPPAWNFDNAAPAHALAAPEGALLPEELQPLHEPAITNNIFPGQDGLLVNLELELWTMPPPVARRVIRNMTDMGLRGELIDIRAFLHGLMF